MKETTAGLRDKTDWQRPGRHKAKFLRSNTATSWSPRGPREAQKTQKTDGRQFRGATPPPCGPRRNSGEGKLISGKMGHEGPWEGFQGKKRGSISGKRYYKTPVFMPYSRLSRANSSREQTGVTILFQLGGLACPRDSQTTTRPGHTRTGHT